MRIGVLTFVTDEGIGPVALGEALEQRGFSSLFLAEHSHIPVNAQTPCPGGGPIPRKYYRTLDPFVALTAAVVATEKLILGTGIALIPQRDPILTAKDVASPARRPPPRPSSTSSSPSTRRQTSVPKSSD